MKYLDVLNYKKDADIIIIKNNIDWLLHFSQNLITKNEKVNYNTEQRKYAPSIIQP